MFFSLYKLNSALKEKFKCNKKRACCSYGASLNKEDITRLEKHAYNKKDFLKGKNMLKTKNNTCIFLVKKADKTYCEIYPIRPEKCRQYLFFKILYIEFMDYKCKIFLKQSRL